MVGPLCGSGWFLGEWLPGDSPLGAHSFVQVKNRGNFTFWWEFQFPK